ncbi:MAG: glycoside hydrolase family 130 protein [Clostridia bacterium]|nr:glycoside hydrolase family 130 protein [Clostridia bacterium]
MARFTPYLDSAPCVKKLDRPILSSEDMPYDSLLVFNAGVTKFNGKYIMVFRNDYGTDPERFLREKHMPGTSVGVAISDNGIDGWQVRKEYLLDNHRTSDETGREIKRFYDPRITILEGRPYLTLAADTRHGVRGCIAEIDDNFEKVNVISMSVPNNRNMVLFPEKIGGYYCRLERPMAMFGEHCMNYDVWFSKSPDLRMWGESKVVLDDRMVKFANEKIGPAAPPVKTEKGWLTTFHAVDYDPARGKNGWENSWPYRYTGGIMLLDLEDPTKVVGLYNKPFIAPDRPYETDEGFRQNTIFPGGMILEDDGEVKIYYGASDCYECVCTANVDDLIKLCLEGGE